MNRAVPCLLLALLLALCVQAQPAFSGAFRGKIADGSELLLGAANGTMGSFSVLSYVKKSLDQGSLTLGTDGAFDTQTPQGVRLKGTFTPTSVSGTYDGQAFTATRIPFYGSSQAVAASYSGYINDQISHSVVALSMLATNQGELFLVVNRSTRYDAGLGAVDATGNFTVTTVAGDKYTGRLAVTSGMATGTMTIAGYGGLPYAVVQTRTGVLQNVSTRGFVGSGDNLMIVGFVVADGSKAVIVRALGPSLAKYGVPNLLADPVLEVFDAAGHSIAQNDDWGSASAVNRIPVASGLASIDAKDAGMVLMLDPGAYTILVKGANGGTGNAIVEVYEVR